MDIISVLKFRYGDIDFQNDVIVNDDGSGQYITKWNLPDPQPTVAEMKETANSIEFLTWQREQRGALIDRDTGKAINAAAHPFVGLEEQIGILRAQIGAILIELGIDPTDGFARLNDIANTAIQAAAEKKEALDESSGSIENAAE